MEIDLRDLRTVTLRLLDHLIETHSISTVKVDKNFYWQVPKEKRFDTSAMPAELDVGSLVDDWEFVSNLLREGSSPVAYQLTELGPLLTFVGEKMSAELAPKGG